MTNPPSDLSTHTPSVADPAQTARHQIRTGPVPDWVSPSSVNVNYQPKRRGGITYLLIDRQIHAELHQTFVRVATRLETMEAVQHQSQWQLPFEPATQSVILHSIVIRRGDTSFDHTRLDKMRWLQREEGLEKFVIDGWFTLLLLLDDVRQGDILEWSYTVIARPRLLPEHCYHLFTLPLGLDIGSFNFSVRRNSSRPLRWKSGCLNVNPVEAAFGNEMLWTWSGSNFSTPELELNVPEGHVGFPWIQISDCSDWATVASAAAKAWAGQKTASEADIRAAAHDIEASQPTLPARAEKAIELLQDTFRYLSVNLDFGGQIPTPPHLVLQRRYGDCKDLSLLLTELLNALGIAARPILVTTDLRKSVSDMLPMPNLFNHVIVEFSLEGKTVWVDVTMKRQGGGALNRFIENFGAGLPVDSTALGIVAAPPSAAESVYEIKESILLDTSGNASFLGVTVRATGRFADALRNQIAIVPIDKVENERLQEWRTRFVNVKRSEPLQHQDDRASNQFFLAEEFAIDGFLAPHPEPGLCAFHSPPSTSLFGVLQVPGPEPRYAPFALSYPCQIVHTLEVESPTFQPMAIPAFYKETDFIRFRRREKSFRGSWSMTLTLTTLSASVPAAALQEYRNTLQEIWGQSGCSLFVPTGYRHPRKRSDFGKLSNSVPPSATVEPISFTRSTSPLFPERDRPVYWPGDKPEQSSRGRRRRRRGLQRKRWLWLALAVSLALLLSFLFYVIVLKRPSGRQGPNTQIAE